jgi:hypothetical protein
VRCNEPVRRVGGERCVYKYGSANQRENMFMKTSGKLIVSYNNLQLEISEWIQSIMQYRGGGKEGNVGEKEEQ